MPGWWKWGGKIGNLRQGHDSREEGDASNGVQVWEMREENVGRCKNHDPPGGPDWSAFSAKWFVGLLQRISSGDHVHDARANFQDKLLRYNNVEPKNLTKSMLPSISCVSTICLYKVMTHDRISTVIPEPLHIKKKYNESYEKHLVSFNVILNVKFGQERNQRYHPSSDMV